MENDYVPHLGKLQAHSAQRELFDHGEDYDQSQMQYEYIKANGLVFRAMELE